MIPSIIIPVVFLLFWFLLSKLAKPTENTLAISLMMAGASAIILNLIISISTAQLVEFFIYIYYLIRKLFNKGYNGFENPLNFKDMHDYLSSEKFVRMWYSYLLSFVIFFTGLIYYLCVPELEVEEKLIIDLLTLIRIYFKH